MSTSVSQPSSGRGATGTLQFADPAAHSESHRPLEHDRVSTLVLEHARPQPPQLSTSNLTFFSQPSSGCVPGGSLQLAQPEMQGESQVPLLHFSEVVLSGEQARPQAPQLDVSVVSTASQPSSGLGADGMRQLPKPAPQLESQRPALQVITAVPADEQARPQAPQLAVLTERSVSQPSSSAGDAGALQLP